MKLEQKHITSYLPYGLKLSFWGDLKDIRKLMVIDLYPSNIAVWSEKKTKPILRPISDFKIQKWKDIFMNSQIDKTEDDWFLEAVEFEHPFIYEDFQNLTYRAIECLFANHFDVFGLIKQGLAIDINTLES